MRTKPAWIKRPLCSTTLVALAALVALPLMAESQTAAQYVESHFTKDLVKHVDVDYRVYLPASYEKTDKPWPLLVWLHGDGGQANRGGWKEIESYGPLYMLGKRAELPFVILAPQLWGEVHWDPDAVHALLLETVRQYDVDPDRVLLMGYSRGGFGAWELASSYPETFAAVVPISARPMTAIERVKEMGVWIFHGELDDGVPVGGALDMHQALKAADADVRLTIYPAVGHNAVGPAMATESLWEWLLAQRR